MRCPGERRDSGLGRLEGGEVARGAAELDADHVDGREGPPAPTDRANPNGVSARRHGPVLVESGSIARETDKKGCLGEAVVATLGCGAGH